jgi:hypothetical protein
VELSLKEWKHNNGSLLCWLVGHPHANQADTMHALDWPFIRQTWNTRENTDTAGLKQVLKGSLFHYRNQLLSLVHCTQLLPSLLFLSKNVSRMYYDSVHLCTPQPIAVVKLGNVCSYCVAWICNSCSLQALTGAGCEPLVEPNAYLYKDCTLCLNICHRK